MGSWGIIAVGSVEGGTYEMDAQRGIFEAGGGVLEAHHGAWQDDMALHGTYADYELVAGADEIDVYFLDLGGGNDDVAAVVGLVDVEGATAVHELGGVAFAEEGSGHLFEHGQAEDLAGEKRDFENGDRGKDFVDGLEMLGLEASPGFQEGIGDGVGDDAIYDDGVGGVVVEGEVGEVALGFLDDHFFEVED